MKRIVTLLLIFNGYMSVFSQEQFLFTNDYLAPFMTNPACTGSEYYPVAHSSIKKQWLGFSESPITYLVAGNYRIGSYDFYNPKGLVNKGPLKIKNRIGIGMAFFQDNFGPQTYNGGLFSYAYHLPVDRESKISFGMSVLLANNKIYTSLLDPNDKNDPFLLTDQNGGFSMNFATGIYYYNNAYFLGISANKMVINKSQGNNPIKNNTFSYFMMGGFKFLNGNTRISIEPSVSLKKIYKEPLIINVHSKVYLPGLNWIAFSYSSIQQLNIQFALRLYKNFMQDIIMVLQLAK
jgi:type IX secretion system PorP/SprF family membrane protein